jgi:hypothetical protein
LANASQIIEEIIQNNLVLIIPKSRIANFQDHTSSQICHVILREVEKLLAPGEGFQELASEHAAIKSILLLWSFLEAASVLAIGIRLHSSKQRASNI